MTRNIQNQGTQMFLFMSLHCKCNIFNTGNIIPPVSWVWNNYMIHYCDWRFYLTPEKTSHKAVNNPSSWSGCCKKTRGTVQPEQCGKSSGCNYCSSESWHDTPHELILAVPKQHIRDASSRCCRSPAHEPTVFSVSPSFMVTKTSVSHKHTPPQEWGVGGRKESKKTCI